MTICHYIPKILLYPDKEEKPVSLTICINQIHIMYAIFLLITIKTVESWYFIMKRSLFSPWIGSFKLQIGQQFCVGLLAASDHAT